MVTGHRFEEDLSAFSELVRLKARRLVRQGGVSPDSERAGVWWVRASTDGTREEYRVEVNEAFASCTCRYGRNMGGDPACSHVLAAILRVTEEASSDA